MRRAGLRGLWLGVEDLSGTLVGKGQGGDKTLQAFAALRQSGIYPVPMMMHHDAQPLVTWRSNFGLLNQLRTLRKAGALFTQILMLTPAPGSKWYEDTYRSGVAIERVGGEPVAPHVIDGNYVVATTLRRPWIKQLNLLAGYTYFFNPLRLLWSLVRSKSPVPLADMDTRPPEEIARLSPWRRFRRRLYLKTRARLIDGVAQRWACTGCTTPTATRFPGHGVCCGGGSSVTRTCPSAGSPCVIPPAAPRATPCRGLPLPSCLRTCSGNRRSGTRGSVGWDKRQRSPTRERPQTPCRPQPRRSPRPRRTPRSGSTRRSTSKASRSATSSRRSHPEKWIAAAGYDEDHLPAGLLAGRRFLRFPLTRRNGLPIQTSGETVPQDQVTRGARSHGGEFRGHNSGKGKGDSRVQWNI